MVPVNEVDARGPAAAVDPRPAADLGAGAPDRSRSRGSTSASGRAHWVVVDARQPEFDYPAGPATPGGGDQDRRRAGPGRPGSALDSTLTRLLFALRFRRPEPADQRPDHAGQPAAHAPDARPTGSRGSRRSCATTRTPTSWSTTTAGSSTSRTPTRPATASRTRSGSSPPRCPRARGLAGDAFNYIRNSVKVTMDAYDGTMTFYAADPSTRSCARTQGVFPALFKPLVRGAGETSAPTCACPRSCSTSRPGCSRPTT